MAHKTERQCKEYNYMLKQHKYYEKLLKKSPAPTDICYLTKKYANTDPMKCYTNSTKPEVTTKSKVAVCSDETDSIESDESDRYEILSDSD